MALSAKRRSGKMKVEICRTSPSQCFLSYRALMTLSVLTERRVNSPPGLAGGGSGSRGRNTLVKADGRKINLGPKTAVPVYPGVRKPTALSPFRRINKYDFA